jgi:ribosome-binding factor A
MESTRQHKVARLIQKDLGEIFQALSRDIFPGNMITVTKVVVAPDLTVARVHLSLFGKTEKNELLRQIITHRKAIRLQLGNRIHNQVRQIPDLEFFLDDSLDYIENIDRLLKGGE